MIDQGKLNVLGVQLSAVDYQAAVACVLNGARRARPMAVSALAVHGLMTGVLDRQHRWRLNRFDLLLPDGQPVRWALNWIYRAGLADRVYGPTLMLKICERAAESNLPVFLFGGTDELLERLCYRLTSRFADLRIAGTMSSRFRRLSAMEKAEITQHIRRSGAKITFVGLGCPRQEVWAHEFKEELSMPLIAVGAAFNFHAGLLPQAPPLLQRYGLEWAYRLAHEPSRLWRRYLLLNPLYVSLVAMQIAGLSLIDADAATPPAEEMHYG